MSSLLTVSHNSIITFNGGIMLTFYSDHIRHCIALEVMVTCSKPAQDVPEANQKVPQGCSCNSVQKLRGFVCCGQRI